MNLGADLSHATSLGQKQTLGARQLQGIALLAKPLPALRAEIVARMEANPAIEDLDHPLETPLSEVEAQRKEAESRETPDYPEDDFTPGLNVDEDAAERRQRFFDNQVKAETLQGHLLDQLPLSDIPREDWPLVETLVGDLDDDGFYRGSIPDACMAYGRTPAEIEAVLAQVTALDPAGCGARTARECLLAQIGKLAESPRRETVRKMLSDHLADIAANRYGAVMSALGISRDEYVAALKELRTLDPHPGRAFPGERDRVEYVNPEVHAVKVDGRWHALTDRRSLPEIRMSGPFADLLKNPETDKATKLYVKGKIAEAEALQEAVAFRQDTLERVAQAAFDRQQEFFEKGFAALKPLTEAEVAAELGLDLSTVSRTVKDKYVALPKGKPVELRRLFVLGVKAKAGDGAAVAQTAVLAKLKEIVAGEVGERPLSDQKLSEALKAAGYPVARRTVAKYRGILEIPDAEGRRKGVAR